MTMQALMDDRRIEILKDELQAVRADLAFRKFLRAFSAHALRTKFDADQPRVPAGEPGAGQWTDGEGGAATNPLDALAQVIRICVAGGIFRFPKLGTYKAVYDCTDGAQIVREGTGRAPGLIRDPRY